MSHFEGTLLFEGESWAGSKLQPWLWQWLAKLRRRLGPQKLAGRARSVADFMLLESITTLTIAVGHVGKNE